MSSPVTHTEVVPIPEAADLKQSANLKQSTEIKQSSTVVSKGSSDSVVIVSDSQPVSVEQKLEDLEKNNKKQERRIKDLELALAESRKVVRNREQLLTQIQFKPKDDFYVWKNPRINDKQVRDALENRLKTLTDQLRVMEKVLGEREAEIEFLYGQQQTMIEGADAPLAQSLGSSGTFSSPMQSPKIINGPTKSPGMSMSGQNWMRSPMTSPVSSPSAPKKRWWNFSSSAIRRGSLGDSSGRVPSPPSHMIPVPQQQAPVTMVSV